MSSFFYYLAAAADSALGVFGIRSPYEQPPYQVVGHLADGVEIRAYGTRVAAQTTMRAGNSGEAFGRLFRYITGANQGDAKIAMTVPVEMAPQRIPPSRIPMTVPVEMTGDQVMRFFLPHDLAEHGPPVPKDPLVHIIKLLPATFAVLRFSGTITDGSRAEHEKQLLAAVAGGGRHAEGEPSVLSYDPPFALPFLRRNEVAVRLDAVSSGPGSGASE
jgi:hypothetical protein